MNDRKVVTPVENGHALAVVVAAEDALVLCHDLGLGHNPSALWAIMDRLALPEDEWKPFDRHLYRTLAFPRPDKIEPAKSS